VITAAPDDGIKVIISSRRHMSQARNLAVLAACFCVSLWLLVWVLGLTFDAHFVKPNPWTAAAAAANATLANASNSNSSNSSSAAPLQPQQQPLPPKSQCRVR
jgi:hypothetical protein